MMVDELLDYYDANMVHLGVKPRRAVHEAGDWHRVFHCWVFGQDADGQPYVIVQKRGADKATFPLYLDVSAAGHYAAGETPPDGVRELQEELGLVADFTALHPVGRRVSAAQFGALLDYEVADVFFYRCDQPLSAYRYQTDELAGLVKLELRAAERLLTQAVPMIRAEASGLVAAQVEIRAADFIPSQDHYFLKVVLLGQRFLRGEREVWV